MKLFMNHSQLTSLSKTVAVALRHNPIEFGLTPDPEGWVSVQSLLQGLTSHNPKWRDVQPEHLQQMIDIADKKRYEIVEGKIRAFYGHSRVNVEKERQTPPEFLYHGTTPKALPLIRKGGLRPMSRQHVHHSTELSTALNVAGRRTNDQVILIVHAKRAFKSGVDFHHGNEDTWLSGPVPAEFIEFPED
jgi:putative RNA 2'-phosphotransferase